MNRSGHASLNTCIVVVVVCEVFLVHVGRQALETSFGLNGRCWLGGECSRWRLPTLPGVP
ncbi:hypothetical protein PF008_g6956 [Phytophthora fragariae]|uniref:Uncharacterized protein n=1 Tax=Phytophthora fragariae TaxID=53985 RepID=A0A6G0S3X5_9STRA|nr:hypothetical protein PF008_g6956 [Phytophthora fragariae]